MAFTQKIDDITALPEVTLSTGLSTQQLGAINAISRNGSARVTSMCGCKRTHDSKFGKKQARTLLLRHLQHGAGAECRMAWKADDQW